MDPGLVILLGCAFLLSLLSLWKFERNWKHAVYVGLASYFVLQIANTIHMGYFDPWFLVGIPVACAMCAPVYYFAFGLLLFMRWIYNQFRN